VQGGFGRENQKNGSTRTQLHVVEFEDERGHKPRSADSF